MNLPFILPTAEIVKKLNHVYPDVVFEGINEAVGVEVKVNKRDSFKVWGEGKYLLVEVPVKVWAKVVWRERLMGALHFMPQLDQIDFEITVRFEIELAATELWSLNSRTSVDFRWDRKPKLGLSLLSVNAASLIRPQVVAELDKITQQIDHYIQQEIALESRVEEFWREMQMPILLEDDPHIWLTIRPAATELLATRLTCNATAIETTVAVPATVKALISPEAEPFEPISMAPFSPIDQLNDHFELALSSIIAFGELERLLIKENLNIGFRQFQAALLKAKASHVDGKLLLDLDFTVQWRKSKWLKAMVKGEILSQIIWDDEAQDFWIDEFEVKLKAKNWWIQLMLGFWKEALPQQIKAIMLSTIYSLDQAVKQRVAKELLDKRLSPHISLRGQGIQISHEMLQIKSSEIVLTSKVLGKLGVWLGDF